MKVPAMGDVVSLQREAQQYAAKGHQARKPQLSAAILISGVHTAGVPKCLTFLSQSGHLHPSLAARGPQNTMFRHLSLHNIGRARYRLDVDIVSLWAAHFR